MRARSLGVWAVLALACFVVPACGLDFEADEYGLEVAQDTLVTNMQYMNTLTGTAFTWTSDGSGAFRVQVPNHFVTGWLPAADLGCPTFGQLCMTTAFALPWTNTVYWYVQGDIDAPYWARADYLPTESTYQPRPAANLSTEQNGSQVTFSWDRSQYADDYNVQIVNYQYATYSPAQLGCEDLGTRCELTITMSISSNNWYVRTMGTGPWGPWVASTYSVQSSPTSLSTPTNLQYAQDASGVIFTWDRTPFATQYRVQVPNQFVNTYDAVDLGCDEGGESTCTLLVQLPEGSGDWYVQARNSNVSSWWAASTYTAISYGYTVSPPTGLSAVQVGGDVEFSWTKSEYAQEYGLQVVNNFNVVISATDLGCGDGQGEVCTAVRYVAPGTGNWYVKARGTGPWSFWTPSTYSVLGHEIITAWDFEGDTLNPSTGSGVARQGPSNTGSGFVTGNPGRAWTLTNWSQQSELDPDRYFEFEISSTGYSGLSIGVDLMRSTTGPQNVAVRYSTDGGSSFSAVVAVLGVGTSWRHFDVDLPEGASSAASLIIRLHGYSAGGSAGTCRIDNVIIEGDF